MQFLMVFSLYLCTSAQAFLLLIRQMKKSGDGGLLVVEGMVSIRSNDEYSSTLIIDRLEFVHRGNYTCTATNTAGSSSHTAELAVNGEL